jgi:hypothetical protein
MATLTRTTLSIPALNANKRKRAGFIARHTPRPCMIVFIGSILAGLSIPVLMLLNIVPTTFAIGLIGFMLALAGGVLTLIFCGEI